MTFAQTTVEEPKYGARRREAEISVAIEPVPAMKTTSSRARLARADVCWEGRRMVEVTGLEPVTFWLPAKRSPN